MSNARLRLADVLALNFSHGGYPLTREFSQRLGACLAYAGYRLGLSPSAVTLCGTAVALGACAAYAGAGGGMPAMVALLLAFQLAYGLDCADGQLARATGATSERGAWLDVGTDYLRYVCLAMAICVVLVRQHEVSPLPALGATTAFAAGCVVLLHTTGYLQRKAGHAAGAETANPLRTALRIALDTPTLLLLVCLFRDHGRLLALYALVTGLLYLAVSVILGFRRLEGPRARAPG